MYQAHGWWFPDQDTHFAEMISKNITRGKKPVYQEPVRLRSISHCKKFDLALDIGANVGLWSRDLCGRFQRVVAFEPVADFRSCLRKNVIGPNLEIRDCALGSVNAMIDMIITAGNTGHTHVDTQSIGRGTIPMHRLDDLGIQHIDYIKIDCEGYESEILLGGRDTILSSKPVMVIEHKKHQDVGHTNTSGAIDLCLGWGARIVDRVRNDIILGW